MADTKDFHLILDAGIPLIVVESSDEPRVLALLLNSAIQRRMSYYEWSATQGLRLGGFGESLRDQQQMRDPEDVLKHIAQTPGPAIYALCDFHPYLDKEPLHVRYLKDIAQQREALGNIVVLVSHQLKLPAELGRFTASFAMRLPSDDELMGMVRKQAQVWSEQNGGRKVRTDSETLRKLIANLRGISHAEAQILIRHAVHTDGAITESDIPEVNRLKFDLLDAEGVLHFEYDTERFANVAGLNNLKQWLALREKSFLDNQEDRPRGVLLLGVQGGGKSLTAKAIAGFWGLPLLRLDFGALYNKYFGESERNLRNSLRQAEMMAPCVLWMDEIEKGLSTAGTETATSQRILGTLLTWMAENPTPVFIVATSNDIAALPPELVRKGRLDEIFFVDLPDAVAREEIFRIHLGKRHLDASRYSLQMLADATDGFTGAEIEQVIVSARYLAAARNEDVRDQDLLQAVERTYPLSVLHAEAVHSLRAWARDRAVPA
ncbi:MAG: AAA family ATPase [Pseudomonadales bacterium]|nr:AAA family ATPase [Pseudomonadales bacterium]MCP5184367.1 AAA family ATPase [Pseudomonadales bacterium]